MALSTVDPCAAFLDRLPITGVNFRHNDYVRITGGEHVGKVGSLVTVLELLPEPSFVVELRFPRKFVFQG